MGSSDRPHDHLFSVSLLPPYLPHAHPHLPKALHCLLRAKEESGTPIGIAMFPRGAGNLQEVPQDLVERCSKAIQHDQQTLAAQPAGVDTLVGTVAKAGIG